MDFYSQKIQKTQQVEIPVESFFVPKPPTTPRFIDTHTHAQRVNKDVFEVQNIVVGKDKLTNQQFFYSVGIHPWYVTEATLEQQLDEVRSLASLDNVYFLGEIGLDKVTQTPWELQKTAFIEQLKIARVVQKPVIVHSVRTIYEILVEKNKQKFDLPFVLHGFQYKQEVLKDVLKSACYCSFGARILQEKSTARLALASIPADRFLLETDGVNISIQDIYSAAAEIRSISIEELKERIEQNFQKIINTK